MGTRRTIDVRRHSTTNVIWRNAATTVFLWRTVYTTNGPRATSTSLWGSQIPPQSVYGDAQSTGLEEQPVVGYVVEGSSAQSAGIKLGHVLLKVNGIKVETPEGASRAIEEGPRPLPLLFYLPDVEVVIAKGEHTVKYDTRNPAAPNSAKDWKPKYIIIGGIISQPWMLTMYPSKSEYT